MRQIDSKGKRGGDRPASDEADEAKEVDPNQTVLKGFESMVKSKRGHPNRVRELRLERMMSKAELARRAGLSPLTISRVEEGYKCRLDTKRKILEALGLSLKDRDKVFYDEEK